MDNNKPRKPNIVHVNWRQYKVIQEIETSTTYRYGHAAGIDYAEWQLYRTKEELLASL